MIDIKLEDNIPEIVDMYIDEALNERHFWAEKGEIQDLNVELRRLKDQITKLGLTNRWFDYKDIAREYRHYVHFQKVVGLEVDNLEHEVKIAQFQDLVEQGKVEKILKTNKKSTKVTEPMFVEKEMDSTFSANTYQGYIEDWMEEYGNVAEDGYKVYSKEDISTVNDLGYLGLDSIETLKKKLKETNPNILNDKTIEIAKFIEYLSTKVLGKLAKCLKEHDGDKCKEITDNLRANNDVLEKYNAEDVKDIKDGEKVENAYRHATNNLFKSYCEDMPDIVSENLDTLASLNSSAFVEEGIYNMKENLKRSDELRRGIEKDPIKGFSIVDEEWENTRNSKIKDNYSRIKEIKQELLNGEGNLV